MPRPPVIVAWIGALLASAATAAPPTVNGYRLVTGRPDTLAPAAAFANFDAGDLVAGQTRWDHDGDNVFFNDTRVGFLWAPASGIRPFAVSESVYFDDHLQVPAEISDNGVVAGTLVFRSRFTSVPFVWSAASGLQFLPLAGQNPNGTANAVGRAGLVVVGDAVQGSPSSEASRAAQWVANNARSKYRAEKLAAPDPWSTAWDVSADGDVVVGDSGLADDQRQAVRWVRRELQRLELVGTASTARFTSSDGSAAIGWADTAGGRVLVRWTASGAAIVYRPGIGATIETIDAINPAATAAVGALSVLGNYAPFVWTDADGFVVLPELGNEAYFDRSEAYDVSDDGRVVVGALQASIQGPGDPPPVGFVWVRGEGTFAVDDLLAGSGFAPLGIFTVPSVSWTGTKILATGDPPRTSFDTNSVIVEIALP